ncbi:MAG: ABC transporter substrate-binding protein [Chloroflexota bacterium]
MTEPRDAPPRLDIDPPSSGELGPEGPDPTSTDPLAGTPGQSSETELRTFLIADIRGYTTYTREHGDQAAAALVARFAELVSEVVVARDGFLIELRGDEALVVFVSARKALRAAIDLQARFAGAELPRGVGIGLDAGEAIPVGDGYRGTALNLAARLCAQAGAGEILASEAVIHLAAKMDGIAYVDARSLKLKGYAETVRAVAVIPADRAKGRRLASGNGGRSRDRRVLGLALIGLAVIALLVGSVGGGFIGRTSTAPASGDPSSAAHGSPGSSAPTASTGPFDLADLPLLAFYDAKTGHLEDTAGIKSPTSISVFAGGSFWQVRADPKSVDQIDPVTHAVVRSFAIPVAQERGFAFSPEALWFTDLGAPRIVRVDKGTGVVTPFPIGTDAHDQAQAGDIAVGAGSIWFSRPDAQEIVRMDPTTGRIQARIPDIDAFTVDFGDGAAWYASDGRVGRIDPATNTSNTPVSLAPGQALSNMAFAGGYGWISEQSEGLLFKVDRTGIGGVKQVRPGIGTPAATSDAVWVSNNRDGTLTRIDAVTSETRTIDTGHATLSIAASEDQLMVAVGPTAGDVIGELEGSILTMTTSGFPWDDPSPDPPNNWDWRVRQIGYITCLGLLHYADQPGPEGWTLQPEAAASMPTVSSDGRTYTFTIRPGLVFSPPSNQPVTAETFRSSIERAMSPTLIDWAPGRQFLDDIVGAQAYREGTASIVEGLSADGDRLTITLVAPSPDFLERLSLPFYCPVPGGTPAARLGLDPDPPVAAAGPYYIAKHIRVRLVVLKKNPNYHGDRPQPFDAIAIHLRSSVSDLLSAVKSGQVDGAMLDGFEPLVGAGGQLDLTWGAGSDAAAAGDQRWFGAPRVAVSYFALNPTRKAFKDPSVRHAVALAIDRRALARLWPLRPANGLLPPSIQGVAAAEVPEADLDRARALMKGRTFTVTMAAPTEGDCRQCDALASELTSQLQAIGITVRLHRSGDPWGDALRPGAPIDIFEAGIDAEYPDAGTLLRDLGDRSWIGRAEAREIQRIRALAGPASIDGAMALDRRIVDDSAAVIPYGYPEYPNYFSEAIDCGFVQPAIGAVDLLSLCRKEAGPSSPAPSAAP